MEYDIWQIIMLASIAGMGSSLLGGLIAICIKKPSKNLIGISLAFASAVLLTLAFMDLIPHAIGHDHHSDGHAHGHDNHNGAGIWLALLGIGVGIGLIFILGMFDKHGHEHVHGILPHNDHCSHDEETKLAARQTRRMVTVAMIVAFAVVLHDFPKGLAIGASGSILVAIAIGFGCLPEGLAIATPLKAGGVKWWKILAVCFAAGLSTVIGAVVGYLVGGINHVAEGIIFAIAAGCIIGVVFKEMLPLSYQNTKNKKVHALAMAVGILLMVALHYFMYELMH
ncbi:MAG: ZIP family metal transporter [Firmicutes bacterium]|nr:ZIP family metal transporter [Bacillota bacterium]